VETNWPRELVSRADKNMTAALIRLNLAIVAVLAALLPATRRAAAADWSAETAAQRLAESTVTVRIVRGADVTQLGQLLQEAGNRSSVVVCSGVSLGGGRLVTFAPLDKDWANVRFRVTLPGGAQAAAQLRVIDRYSSLVLLDIPQAKLPGLPLAEQLPPLGGAVVTAAASGIEKPAVSLGILSGVDRSLAGVELPPLLQCDVRTTETSCGAAVVDREGRLLGIIAATPEVATGGWTYAVPARHVERLQRIAVPDQVVELSRRRPVVGFTVGPGPEEGTVVVERVEPGGPADRAGIKPGDILLEADGLHIRSAYQAVALILKKQPGDRMSFALEQAGQRREVELGLDGTSNPVALRPAEADPPPVRLGPQLRIVIDGRQIGLIGGTPGQAAAGGEAAIVGQAIGGNTRAAPGQPAGPQEVAVGAVDGRHRTPPSEVEMLRTQLAAFEKVIHNLQAELAARRAAEAQTTETIQSLQQQVRDLQRQLDEAAR
jgi:S1-C subfamily serine protease